MEVHYVICVVERSLFGKDTDGTWRLRECRYNPETGEHRLGQIIVTGSLELCQETKKELEDLL